MSTVGKDTGTLTAALFVDFHPWAEEGAVLTGFLCGVMSSGKPVGEKFQPCCPEPARSHVESMNRPISMLSAAFILALLTALVLTEPTGPGEQKSCD